MKTFDCGQIGSRCRAAFGHQVAHGSLGFAWRLCVPAAACVYSPAPETCQRELPVLGVDFGGSRVLAVLSERSGGASAVQQLQSPSEAGFWHDCHQAAEEQSLLTAAHACLSCVSFCSSPAIPLPPRVWPGWRPELWPGWPCPFSALTPGAEQPCHPEIPFMGGIHFLS